MKTQKRDFPLSNFDIAVIGGGPAGIMAAGIAARSRAKVILIERNKILGKKLLITGRGRCNITNADADINNFVENFGPKGKFLYSGLQVFGVDETIDFFNKIGITTCRERGNRIFPVKGDASYVVKALQNFLKSSGVKIIYNTKVCELINENNLITRIKCDNTIIHVEKIIICTGGASFPHTGSTGDGLVWAGRLGHKIIDLKPALVPLKVKESWITSIGKLDLKNVNLSVLQNESLRLKRFGDISFLGGGLGGPVVLDISRMVARLLESGRVHLHIDLKPALDYHQLDLRVQRELKNNQKRRFEFIIKRLLPIKIVPAIIQLTGIDPGKQNHLITKTERKKLVHQLKQVELNVTGTFDIGRAIITSGGVDLKGVDSRTMNSKLIQNLYFAGEILDLDGPTGGYNLQVCWTTGYLAGKAAAKHYYK